jgi:ribosomal protein L29
MKKIKDLKLKDKDSLEKLSSKKLIEEIKWSEKKMFSLRMKLSLWELKQTHLIKILRRYIARLNTMARNKKV